MAINNDPKFNTNGYTLSTTSTNSTFTNILNTTWVDQNTGTGVAGNWKDGNFAYTWDSNYNDILKEEKIKELEKKVKAVVRKKIDDIDIDSIEDFVHFLGVLMNGLRDLIEDDPEEDLDDNIHFLLDELEKELNQWIEQN